MLNKRHGAILGLLQEQGALSLAALAQALAVSAETVRRDVQRLAEAGLLARFHGGVRLPISTTENIAYRQRQAMESDGKIRIAKEIAKRIPNGCSLLMTIVLHA